MPSLNLLPKVHKLSDEASSGNERLLRGRPIITGHSWCLIEPSKFIQKELRSVILLFRQYLKEKFLRDSILCSSSDLVEILKRNILCFGLVALLLLLILRICILIFCLRMHQELWNIW